MQKLFRKMSEKTEMSKRKNRAVIAFRSLFFAGSVGLCCPGSESFMQPKSISLSYCMAVKRKIFALEGE
jgi:hypothetical protein